MKIAVSSGKGGTGKTTVATNLAVTAARAGRSVGYLDCDVEEPNGFLFLKPQIDQTQPVNVSIPKVDLDTCNGCGQCGRICQYSAVVSMNKQVLVFPDLCHGCGGCWLVCPTGAITESHRQTGQLESGSTDGMQCVQGLLNIGEVMSPPVIEAVKDAAPDVEILVIDSPPGTSCPVIESVRDSDFVLLVTEPTPFGLNDLKLAVEMVQALKLPFAVVINRADVGDGDTRQYCQRQRIDVLAEIPDDRQVAEAYSRGEMACDAVPTYRELYSDLLDSLTKRVPEHAG
ncbi:MAG: P-loop NTPase [Planctomycetes bacterium]|jgi:MinD superfamily P-loop ATPase|nr:P-loop NTPase [Planctomycetota bacterium]